MGFRLRSGLVKPLAINPLMENSIALADRIYMLSSLPEGVATVFSSILFLAPNESLESLFINHFNQID